VTHIPELFGRYRGQLGELITQLRTALGDPDAAHGQHDRITAWTRATEQFLNPDYWSAALDVHLAGKRAEAADRDRQLADAAAADHRTAHQAATLDVQERASHLNLTHPTQNL
jgi:hypothetical protein